MVFNSLVNNAAILLVLSYLYTLISRYWKGKDLTGQAIRGLLFGFVVVGVMLSPLQLAPGLVFDTRSVVISIAGLFGGPITAAITALFSITYRIWLGGVGVAPAIATALSAASIGVLFFYWRQKWRRPSNVLYFYLFGLAVHVAMILGMFTLPGELAWQTIGKITLPVMVIYPVATLLLAMLLADQEARLVTERQLLESEARFRTLFEQAGDAIFVSDFQGNLVDVNQAAQESLGYSREELLTLRIQDVDPQAPGQEVLQDFWLQQFLGGQHASTFASVHRRKDGSTFPVELRASFTVHKGQRLILGLARDISERIEAEEERKRLEGQLLHAQKMEAVGTLAGGIAHEFNNILAAIMGYTELSLLQYNRGGIIPPEYLEEILASSKRAAKLVKSILAFSRKAESVEFRDFDINTELDHAITLLEKTLPREISIEKDLSPDVGLIRGDAGQFEQVLLNLGTNAKHAMPTGGRLTIKTEQVSIRRDRPPLFPGMKPGEYVLLTVSDSGYGMDAATLKQIFDPFFTTKGLGVGTGLGLAMVYGIIKGHHGYIDCRSAPNEGATFEIFLPVAKDTPQLSAQPSLLAQQPRGKNETVLVVEDESSLLAIGKTMLEANNYHVLQATSGEEALSLFQAPANAIDIVLLDVSMPGMGGMRCLQALLELKPTAKIILTSGYAVDESLGEIIASGAIGFVAKPYSQQDLLQAIHAALVS